MAHEEIEKNSAEEEKPINAALLLLLTLMIPKNTPRTRFLTVFFLLF